MMSTADQYRIIASQACWIERADRGRLRVEGRDAIAFLQALLTNDMQALTAGHGIYAAYLTPHGRMLADLRIHHRGDHLLAQVASAQAASLAARFDQLIFAEDVRVSDVSTATAQLTVIGARAADLVSLAIGAGAPSAGTLHALAPLGCLTTDSVTIARSDDVAVPAFDVFCAAGDRDGIVRWLQHAGIAAGAFEVLDALRIEAGRPAYGVDMTEETIPLEAGLLERAISTTKGCYVGQEIVIRILHRGGGRVAKRLVKLTFDGPGALLPASGAPLTYDGRDVGRITSVARSPNGGVIALGYVHRDQAEIGARVSTVAGTTPMVASIAAFAG